MYKLPIIHQFNQNHIIPEQEIQNRANFILGKGQAANSKISQWRNHLKPKTACIKRRMHTAGNTRLHDLKFHAAQAKPLYKTFGTPKLRTYGDKTMHHLENHAHQSVKNLIQEICEDKDIRQFSRHAPKFYNKVKSNTLARPFESFLDNII